MASKDLWAGVKKFLGTAAPLLGNAIMPGVGGVAGSMLAKVLGLDSTDPEKMELALLSATPEQIAAIKKLEFDNEERLIELGIENDKLHVQDRQSAREREMEIVRATGGKDYNLYILAWVMVTGFLSLCIFLLFKTVPTAQSSILYMLLGTFATAFVSVINYFFGSSKGSADKTKYITAMNSKGK